jgi:hypothetical protein
VLSESPPLLPLCPPGWSMLDFVGHSENLETTVKCLSNGICHIGLLTACEQDQDGTWSKFEIISMVST